MPTSAKLIAGVFLALTAIFSWYLFRIAVPDTIVGLKFYVVSGVVGLAVGWRAIGGNPGFGGIQSVFYGLRGTIILVVSNSLVFGGWHVVIKLEGFFIKKFISIIDTWASASLNYFTVIAAPEIAIALIVGGAISGIAAGLANRFWD